MDHRQHGSKAKPRNRTEKPNEATKLRVNKYKIATAVQDHRMDKLEAAVAAIEKASTLYKDDVRITTIEQNIASIAQSQSNTAEAIKQVVQGQGETKAFVKELTEKVKYNKKQADEDHKIMTDAMKVFHDNLVQSQTMINALQRGSELPTRKKRATSQHRQRTNSDHDSDEYSFNSTKMGPLSAVSHPDNFFQSDANMDDMEGAAEEISKPDSRGGGKINTSLNITSSFSNINMSETTKTEENTNNNETK